MTTTRTTTLAEQHRRRCVAEWFVETADQSSLSCLVKRAFFIRVAFLLGMAVVCAVVPEHLFHPGDDVSQFALSSTTRHNSTFRFALPGTFCECGWNCQHENYTSRRLEVDDDDKECQATSTSDSTTATHSSVLQRVVYPALLRPLTRWDSARFLRLARQPQLRYPTITKTTTTSNNNRRDLCDANADKSNDNNCASDGNEDDDSNIEKKQNIFLQSEQSHAFLPLLILVIQCVTWGLLFLRRNAPLLQALLPDTCEQCIILSAWWLNTLLFMIATVSLYSMTRNLLWYSSCRPNNNKSNSSKGATSSTRRHNFWTAIRERKRQQLLKEEEEKRQNQQEEEKRNEQRGGQRRRIIFGAGTDANNHGQAAAATTTVPDPSSPHDTSASSNSSVSSTKRVVKMTHIVTGTSAAEPLPASMQSPASASLPDNSSGFVKGCNSNGIWYERWARRVTLLFIVNPANVFFGVVYSESLFAALVFTAGAVMSTLPLLSSPSSPMAKLQAKISTAAANFFAELPPQTTTKTPPLSSSSSPPSSSSPLATSLFDLVYRSIVLLAWILCFAAAWTRSNGMLYAGFVFLWGMGKAFTAMKPAKTALKKAGAAKAKATNTPLSPVSAAIHNIVERPRWLLVVVRSVHSILTSALLVVASMGRYNYQAYQMHCISSFSNEQDQEQLKPDWCQFGPSFNLYSHIQGRHWNVGLFRYYQWKQLPNFLLAAPILVTSVLAVRTWIYNCWMRYYDNYRCQRKQQRQRHDLPAVIETHGDNDDDAQQEDARHATTQAAAAAASSDADARLKNWTKQQHGRNINNRNSVNSNGNTTRYYTKRLSFWCYHVTHWAIHELQAFVETDHDDWEHDDDDDDDDDSDGEEDKEGEHPNEALLSSTTQTRREYDEEEEEAAFFLVSSPLLLGHYAVLAAATLLGLLIAHVQISTRMICSTTPAIYWFLTAKIVQHPDTWGRFVLSYCFLYMVLGVVMHSTWLPWT